MTIHPAKSLCIYTLMLGICSWTIQGASASTPLGVKRQQWRQARATATSLKMQVLQQAQQLSKSGKSQEAQRILQHGKSQIMTHYYQTLFPGLLLNSTVLPISALYGVGISVPGGLLGLGILGVTAGLSNYREQPQQMSRRQKFIRALPPVAIRNSLDSLLGMQNNIAIRTEQLEMLKQANGI